MATDGKDKERMDILTARFIQIQAMPESAMYPPALIALDERGRIWDYSYDRKVWTMLSQERELPRI